MMNLTEATILALQGKLNLNESAPVVSKIKRAKPTEKKEETIEINLENEKDEKIEINLEKSDKEDEEITEVENTEEVAEVKPTEEVEEETSEEEIVEESKEINESMCRNKKESAKDRLSKKAESMLKEDDEIDEVEDTEVEKPDYLAIILKHLDNKEGLVKDVIADVLAQLEVDFGEQTIEDYLKEHCPEEAEVEVEEEPVEEVTDIELDLEESKNISLKESKKALREKLLREAFKKKLNNK